MNPIDVLELAALDQAWMEAEQNRDVYQRLAGEPNPHLAASLVSRPEVGQLIRQACAIVGLECERRIRERTADAD